jgi:signal transduction histidine kinase
VPAATRPRLPAFPFRAVLVVACAGVGMTALHLVGRVTRSPLRGPLAFVEQAAILLAFALAVRASRKGPEEFRPVWRRVSLGLLCTVVASTIAQAIALVTGSRPASPAVSDLFYLAAYPFYAAAVFAAPRRPKRLGWRDVIDGVAVGGLLAIAVARHVVEPVAASTRVGTATIAMNLFFVVVDLALLWIVVAMMVASHGFRQLWVGVLALGLAVLVSGDLSYLTASAQRPISTDSLLFLVFLWGFLLVSLAAWWAARPRTVREVEEAAQSEWEQPGFQVLPLALLAGVIALVAVEAYLPSPRTYVTLGGLAVALLLGVRQVLTLRENRRLLAREREVVYRLRDLDKMRTDFIAMVSHELANPLTAIRGLAFTLLRDGHRLSDEERREMVASIEGEAIRLIELSRDVLSAARAEQGHLAYSFEPVDVAAVADRCARLAGQISSQHDVVFERSGSTVIDGDEARLQEMFVNLIHNGIKYSPRGGIVTVRVRGDREHVRASVSDEGIGFHPAEVERIFDGLVRLRNRETEGIEGTGLGLYIVRKIVEAHGGRIMAEGRPGKGATFTVDLPRERPAQLGDATERVPALRSDVSSGAGGPV